MNALHAPRRDPSNSLNIIGISAYFHDSACCLLQDGILTAAAQEERFSRRKHDDSLPVQAFQWCLRSAGLTIADIACVAYYENPYKKLERQLWQTWPVRSPQRTLDCWQRARRPLDAIRNTLGFDGEIDVYDHHQSHAASTFFYSGATEAAILTVDGVGEWATTTYGHGRSDRIEIFESVQFPDSIGLLYSTLTNYLGFAVNDGEYKVMGLAPYGTPRYVTQIRSLIESAPMGQFRLNTDYFEFLRDDRMHSDALTDLLRHPPRRRGEPILPFHQDLASSLQKVLEEILLEKVRYLYERVPVDTLCMAGGVALNCVANGRILREGPFRTLFIQPAAGDAGCASGAAALAHLQRRAAVPVRRLDHVYLGPAYSTSEVAETLQAAGITPCDYRGDESGLIAATVERLMAGQIVAWFQGAMEFGPRALGSRSILADPRDPTMRDRVNLVIKEREGFRPFAPAVLEREASTLFDLDHASPFMLETCQVVSDVSLPAITHVDGTARVQTVDGVTHPRFARLLEAFHQRTGCPALLNTSFNLKDEPIVASPVDALLSFTRVPLDALVIEDFLIERQHLNPWLQANCRRLRPVPGMTHARAYTF